MQRNAVDVQLNLRRDSPPLMKRRVARGLSSGLDQTLAEGAMRASFASFDLTRKSTWPTC